MELGGSDAFIVLKDADLDQTVKWAVWGKMNNMGQCCVAAKRLIVVEELADRFLDSSRPRWRHSSQEIRWTRRRRSTLSTEAALIKVLHQIKQAVAKGAIVVMGGKRIDRPGSFMQPTILTNIKPGNPAFRRNFSAGRALLPGQK